MKRDKINQRQRAILQRIADAVDPVTSRDHRLAVTVYALRDRGLVTAARRGGDWTAEITDAGRFFLRHGRHPASQTTSDVVVVKREPRPRRRLAIEPSALIDRITASDGVLTIPNLSPPERASWRRAIHAAHRGTLPEGMVLQYAGRGDGDLIIRLVLRAEASDVPRPEKPKPIPVPERLLRPHPIVMKLKELGLQRPERNAFGWSTPMTRGDVQRLDVSRPTLPRALRILQALFSEAEARGYQVRPERDERKRHICIVIKGHEYAISLREKDDLLRLTLPREYSGRRLWSDGARTKLEVKLADVLANLEARADEAEERRLEQEQHERERQLEWERATERARARYFEDQRASVLREQIANWHLAADIREYCLATDPRSNGDESQEWLAWALKRADEIDPLLQELKMPDVPEPDARALQPYLPRWSP